METSALKAESLLRLIRARCSNAAVREERACAEMLVRIALPESDVVDRTTVRAALRRVFDDPAFDRSLRLLALTVSGLDPSTDGVRMTRSAILEVAAVRTQRTRNLAGESQLSQRRMEQIERQDLIPAIMNVLGRTVISDAVWENCEIDLSVAPSGDGHLDHYSLRSDTRVKTSGERVLIASIEDESAADWICIAHPEIFDVYMPRPGGSLSFNVHLRQEGNWAPIEMKADTTARDELLAEYPQLRNSALSIWSAETPIDIGSYELRVVASVDVELSDRYFYWTAARRTYLRRFRADASLLTPAPSSIEVRQRMGRVVEPFVDIEMRRVEVEFDGWLNAGHAVEVWWRQ